MSMVTGSSTSERSLPSSSTVLRGRITSCRWKSPPMTRLAQPTRWASGGTRVHAPPKHRPPPAEPVAVGRDRLQRPLVDHEQHAVQVIANVLLRHRELDRLQESAQVALRKRKRLDLVLPLTDPGVVGGWERLQVETRDAG